MIKQKFQIEVRKETLSGLIEGKDLKNPVVLFIVGLSGGALGERFDPLSQIFVEAGYTFVRFNFTGQEAGSTVDHSSLVDEVEDLLAVHKYLGENQIGSGEIAIIAKSFGALKFLLTCDKISPKCAVMLSPAIFLDRVGNIEQIKDTPYEEIKSVQDIKVPSDQVELLSIPTLIVHGENDTTVPPADARSLSELIPDPNKELLLIPGAEHTMKDEPFASEVYQLALEYVKRHLKS